MVVISRVTNELFPTIKAIIASLKPIKLKWTQTDHDAFGQIVKDSGLQLKKLPTDDGVRQGELQEEGLEDRQ